MLDENIEGYYLGESFNEFRERVGTSINWTEIPGSKYDQRGTLLAVSGTPSKSRKIKTSRLTFFEDHLMEVVLYYKRNSFS